MRTSVVTDALDGENVGVTNPSHKKLRGRDREIATGKARLEISDAVEKSHLL